MTRPAEIDSNGLAEKGRRLAIPIGLLLLLGASGCSTAATGPLFVEPGPVAPEKALVYIYRPRTERSGYDRVYSLYHYRQLEVDLLHGGYYPYVVDPGPQVFAVTLRNTAMMALTYSPILTPLEERDAVAVVELMAEAGGVYYLEFHPETTFTKFIPRLAIRDATVGEEAVRSCRLLEPVKE